MFEEISKMFGGEIDLLDGGIKKFGEETQMFQEETQLLGGES